MFGEVRDTQMNRITEIPEVVSHTTLIYDQSIRIKDYKGGHVFKTIILEQVDIYMHEYIPQQNSYNSAKIN